MDIFSACMKLCLVYVDTILHVSEFKHLFNFSDLNAIKLSLCFAKVSMEFILLRNVTIPTSVGTLAFINRINTAFKTF